MIRTGAQIYMHWAVSRGPISYLSNKTKKIIDGIVASVKHDIPKCKFFRTRFIFGQ